MAKEVLYSHDVYNTQNYTVRFEALVEHLSLEDTMDENLIEDTAARINSGELVHFCAKVSLWFDGTELATEYLGSCIYESFEEFHTTYKTGYFHDMVKVVISEGRQEIERLKGLLCTANSKQGLFVAYRTKCHPEDRNEIQGDEYVVRNYEEAMQQYEKWLTDNETWSAGIAKMVESTDHNLNGTI